MTEHVFRHTMSTILHEEDLTLRGLKLNVLMWTRVRFVGLITMHNIWMGVKR